jgi:two-component system, cell cycle sensor histidine kinase and response regulator CckA
VSRSERTRLQAEEALLDERFLPQTLVETSPDHIYFKDTERRFIRINPSLARHFGLDDPADAIGKTDADFFSGDHVRKTEAEEERLVREGVPIVNLEERETWYGRGDTWVATTKVPMRAADGTIIGLVGISRDITESRRTKEQLAVLEAQKVESLSALAGGIAHDFNNLLVGVLGNASLALSELPADARARATVQEIVVAGERMAKLAREMLVYAGRGRFVLEPLDLSRTVAEVARTLRGVVPAETRLDLDGLERGLPPIDGDEAQVRQVIATLLTNAFEAIGDGPGKVTVGTSVVEADREYLSGFTAAEDIAEGSYVCVRVTDTGRGISPEEQTRIFEPFFTTKFTGRGLGLAALIGIVRGHRGGVKVATELGQGTTFTVVFPVAPNRRPETANPALPIPVGTVLVADDDDVVRTVTARMLERSGFEVVTAADGEAAVEIFAARASEIVAVVLDLVMPGRSGEEVLVEIRARRPDCPVLLCSGYSGGEAPRPVSDGLVRFISKPYTAEQLVGTLRELLTRPNH